MDALIENVAIAVIALLVYWLVIEPVIRRLLPMCAGYLPDDMCGPGGWLIDTTGRGGIFDRPTRDESKPRD